MTDVEQVNEDFQRFIEGIQNLKEVLEPLKKFHTIGDLEEKASLSDYAQLNASMAYCLNSLYYMYMKVNGIALEDHKIHGEIQRIKEYFERIQESVTNERVRQNPHEVNKEAAQRLIKAHLKDNDKEEMKQDEDLWKGEEPKAKSSKKVSAAKMKEKMEEELAADGSSDEEENPKDTGKKAKGKKLHKGSLLATGTHISWKDEIEKMLK